MTNCEAKIDPYCCLYDSDPSMREIFRRGLFEKRLQEGIAGVVEVFKNEGGLALHTEFTCFA